MVAVEKSTPTGLSPAVFIALAQSTSKFCFKVNILSVMERTTKPDQHNNSNQEWH